MANLGTFHLHAGEIDAGIDYIRRAIEVNPDAHFGRERYQLLLAEHVRDGRPGSFVAPLILDSPVTRPADAAEMGRVRRDGHDHPDDAIEGVIGMLRFGTGTSPHLFYALGDLLAARGDRHLAAFAYLRAIEHDHPRSDEVQEALDQTIELISDEPTADDLRAELDKLSAEAAAWVASFQAYEDARVRAGDDPNAAGFYDAFYAEHGEPVDVLALAAADHRTSRTVQLLVGFTLALVALAAMRVWSRKRRTAQRSAFQERRASREPG